MKNNAKEMKNNAKEWWIVTMDEIRGPYDGLSAVKHELHLPLTYAGKGHYQAISLMDDQRRMYYIMTEPVAIRNGFDRFAFAEARQSR